MTAQPRLPLHKLRSRPQTVCPICGAVDVPIWIRALRRRSRELVTLTPERCDNCLHRFGTDPIKGARA
jgi:hypothetical protein